MLPFWYTKKEGFLLIQEKYHPSREEVYDILAAHKEWLDSKGKEGQQADFTNMDLHGLDLRSFKREHDLSISRVIFRNASLSGSQMENCNFNLCDFEGATFDHSQLFMQYFKDCIFERCSFEQVEINHGSFLDCDMKDVRFRQIRLNDVSFEHNLMENASLSNLVCNQNVSFFRNDLSDSVAVGADLSGAEFRQNDFRGAKFMQCAFDSSNFVYNQYDNQSDIFSCNLENCRIQEQGFPVPVCQFCLPTQDGNTIAFTVNKDDGRVMSRGLLGLGKDLTMEQFQDRLVQNQLVHPLSDDDRTTIYTMTKGIEKTLKDWRNKKYQL